MFQNYLLANREFARPHSVAVANYKGLDFPLRNAFSLLNLGGLLLPHRAVLNVTKAMTIAAIGI
jgi:hypothetical protein